MVKKSILAKVGDKINYKLIRDGYKTGKGNVVVTAEMDTKTTIVADVPSTAYTSNLDYEVDLSGQNPPIINIKNDITCPDDTVISKGKYLFYDIGQEYKIKGNTDIVVENFDKVGNITVNNGIVSNFSANNYLKKEFYNKYGIGDEINIKIKLTSNTSTGRIYSWEGVDVLFFGNDYKLYTYSWSQANAVVVKNSLDANKDYYIKTTRKLGKRIYYFSLDGENYDEGVEVIDTAYPLGVDSVLYLGQSHFLSNAEALKGSIDLKDTYLKSNDKVVWEAVETGEYIQGIKDFTLKDNGNELTTKLFDYHYREEIPYKVNLTKIGNISVNSDGTVSNFSTSNYLRMLDKPSSSTTNFEMLFHFKCTSFSNSEILMGDSGNVWNNVLIYVYNNRFQIGNNRYWYTGTHDISLNKEYWGKVIFNNGTLSSYISEDGITYEQDYTGSLSSYTWINNADIGYSAADNIAFKGTIWLEDCYVQYGNEEKKYFAEKPQLNDKTSLYINSEKDNNLYYEKDELQLNVSKVGSTVINENGIASNFSASDYLDLGNFDFSGDYEIVLKFKMPETDSDTSNYKPFFDAKSNSYFNIAVTSYKNDNKRHIHSNSGNGSSWNTGIDGTTPLELNTEYYVKVVRSGTTRTMYLSTDNVTWSAEGSVEDTYNYSHGYCLGAASHLTSQEIFKGTIDLTKCYIQIGTNEKKYFAEKVTKRYDISSLYSEFVDNITIPAHALFEYVNGEWKLSSTSPLITQDITVNADNAEIAMKEIIE